MNKKLIAVIAATAMAGSIGFASVASADFNWYGSLRAGLVSSDNDEGSSDKLDLGATGYDGSVGGQGLYTRIGVKGSTDLGNGSSAGFKLERGVGDTLSNRHHNVWTSGAWGKLTFGQQDNPYRSARKWDQTWFLGGQYSFNDGGSRIEGVRYDLASGPFGLSVMATANDDSSPEATEDFTVQKNDTVDSWIIAAGYDFGAVNLNVAHRIDNTDVSGAAPAVVAADANTDEARLTASMTNAANRRAVASIFDTVRSSDNTAIGINGSVGPFGWYLAYQISADNANTTSQIKNDVNSFGAFISLSASDNDTLYAYRVNHGADRNTYKADESISLGTDVAETILGYSHSFGGGATFIAEYLMIDKGLPSGQVGNEPDVLALALKVDF